MATLKNVTGAKLQPTQNEAKTIAKELLLKQAGGKEPTIRRAGINPLAISLASKISPETFRDLELTVEAKETTNISGIVLAFDVEHDFTEQEIASMPRVDTCPPDANGRPMKEGFPVSANNPDWTQVQEGKRMKWVSFFNTMISHSKWLKDLEAEIEAYVDAENKKEGHNKALAQMGKGQRQAALQKLRGRRSTVQNTFRRGVEVVQQKQAMKDLFQGVINFSYYVDKKDELIPSPSPIILQMVKKPDCFDTFSVTSFLSLDFQATLDNRESDSAQATWDALIDTLKREQKAKVDPNMVNITNREQFNSGAAAMLHFLEDEQNVRGIYNSVDKVKDLKDVSHLIKTYCKLATEWTDIYNHFQAKFAKLEIAEQAAEGKADAKSIQQALTN